MIRQLWAIAATETLMSRRTWRFWLIVLLLLGIVYLSWRDYMKFIESGMYLAPDHSFGNRSYEEHYDVRRPWISRSVNNYAALLSLAIIWIGGVALALDSCSRLRRTGMEKILFPRPFATFTFVLGRYLGVLLVILPVAAVPWIGFGLLQTIYGHSEVVWQPFLSCYAFVVVPVLIPLVALALWLRSVLKHDLAAILFIGLFSVLFVYLARDPVDILRRNWQALVGSSPALGARIDFHAQLPGLLILGFLTLFFLLLAPFHLRRQEPQRRILRRGGYRWFAIPTFLRWLTDLRMDRNLPVLLKVSALIAALVVGAGAVFGYIEVREANRKQISIGKRMNELRESPPPTSPFDLLNYDIELAVDFRRNRIESASTILIRSATDNLSSLRFFLNRGLEIREASSSNGVPDCTRDVDILTVNLPSPLVNSETMEIRLQSEGSLIGWSGVKSLHPDFGFLNLEDNWYPVQYRPLSKFGSATSPLTDPDLFQARITVVAPSESTVVFPSERLQTEDRNGQTRWVFRTGHPVEHLQVLWGDYREIKGTFGNISSSFYHFPGHRYQAQIYLEDMGDEQKNAFEKFGPFPFSRMVFCEIPMDFSWGLPGESMPGFLPVAESRLVYLHEAIWKLDRLDLKPSEVPFFSQLESTVRDLHRTFRDFLVTNYFRKTFHTVGPYAFWLNRYLPMYVEKSLETASWRRWLFNYDAGALPDTLAPVVARSITDIHNDNPASNAERLRGEGVFRMLHHLLGEENWTIFLHRFSERFKFRDVSDRDILRLANELSDQPLDWFFEQWLYGDVLPRYEITLAEARVVKKSGAIRVAYKATVRIKNHGTGKMAVPIYVQTERDHILRNLWLDTGQEDTLTLETPHRPTFAMVDPEHWVLQDPFVHPDTKARGHSERKFDVLLDSESQPAVSAAKPGGETQ
jgi:ABC-type transport system involved in multi-copper enzyme maturation permease subunit